MLLSYVARFCLGSARLWNSPYPAEPLPVCSSWIYASSYQCFMLMVVPLPKNECGGSVKVAIAREISMRPQIRAAPHPLARISPDVLDRLLS